MSREREHWKVVRSGIVVAAATLVALLAGCGGSDDSSGAAAESSGANDKASLTKVKFRTDWTLAGYAVPYVVAEKQGYYEDAGLDVEINEGKGTALTTQTVASGADTFGLVDVSGAATLASKGAPVRAVAVFTQKSPAGLAYLPSRVTLGSPEDMVGKNIGLTPGSVLAQIFPAVVSKNGLEDADIETSSVSAEAKAAALFGDRIDAVETFSIGTFTGLKVSRPETEVVLWSDWGVNLLSLGLIANEETIDNDSDTVRGFVEASVKGWEWAVANPQEAVDMVAPDFPEADPEALLISLEGSDDLFHTERTEGKPLGWMAEEDWQETLDLMSEYGDLKGGREPSSYFTNDFIPGQDG